ncbi:MAG TPA: acyclic terpene utilization AtuA family protein [Mycobacteriales bacterium]|nr:acyclic terpene utilization AtuA family protein [Mycobacteriales bacterium]
MARPVRIGNCSGFYGDRFAAMREMLEGGELDVLTGDYLAELTMLILFRSQAKDPARGYATTFLRQLEDCLGLAWEKGVRIVANAGGLNPAGCADAVRELAGRLGLRVNVAHVEGDDLMSKVGELRGADGSGLANLDTGAPLSGDPLTANAYLGGWGIATALDAGAQVVVTGRVTDAALVIGPAAWWHKWARDDWDQLAGALVTGHVLECGAQATGGNYSFFTEIPDNTHLGFPLAEIAEDGSSVVTKHPGTGGAVTVGTVTAQLLYEIGAPAYLNPDVTARFDTIRLAQEGDDRVRISGVHGAPPPKTTKVCLNLLGGFRNSMTFLLTGLDIEAKADLVRRQLSPALEGVDSVTWTLARTDHEDPETNEQAVASLRVTVKDQDAKKIGRPFSSAAVEIALASYPGCTLTSPPGDATMYGVYWPALVANDVVEHAVVLDNGDRVAIDAAPTAARGQFTASSASGGEAPGLHETGRPAGVMRAPLGTVAGARSGDKGGNANLGVWVESDAAYQWLSAGLTVEKFKELLPETKEYDVQRFDLPNIRALNFVVHGLLGEGVAAGTRQDPQAKGLGEWLRARHVNIPLALLEDGEVE